MSFFTKKKKNITIKSVRTKKLAKEKSVNTFKEKSAIKTR